MQRRFIILGSIIGMLGVAIGAFGAHGLADLLKENGREGTFETATRYQMYHALALLAVAWLAEKYNTRLINWAGNLLTLGVILFSGSLYVLALFNIGIMGAVAPIGGAAMIAGWACMALSAWQQK